MKTPPTYRMVSREEVERERQFYNNDDPVWLLAHRMMKERDAAISVAVTCEKAYRKAMGEVVPYIQHEVVEDFIFKEITNLLSRLGGEGE